MESTTNAINSIDLSIKALKTVKSKIPQRLLMEKNIIPKHPSSVISNGCSGSGKSNLLASLLTRGEFFKGYFNQIYLFSPTGDTDDMFSHIKIPKKNVFTSMKPSDLLSIMDKQEKIIKKKGVDKAPRILVIFEDVQGNNKFMKSKPFLRAFIANRHFGMSTWLCSQSFTKTPRACRLQANNIFFFKGSGSEKMMMMDEFCPAGINKKEFERLIDSATEEPYSFLHINMRVAQKERYRCNLGEIINY